MRARNIKPGFFVNEQLAECCFAARILFEGLWCLADREGRLEDKPKKIKIQILPYDDVDADALLDELQEHDLIVRYAVGEQGYIEIPTFSRHQNPHIKEPKSVIPPSNPQEAKLQSMGKSSTNSSKAPDKNSSSTVQAPDKNSSGPADSGFLIPDSGFLNLKAEAGGGDQELLLTYFTPEENEIVRLFSGVNGLKFDAQKLVQQVRDLRGEYPNVNILSEAKKMALWLDCADGKKKSGKRNLLLFVRNWVERANNTPSPPLRDFEKQRNGPQKNPDGSYGTPAEGNKERNRRLAEKYGDLV